MTDDEAVQIHEFPWFEVGGRWLRVRKTWKGRRFCWRVWVPGWMLQMMPTVHNRVIYFSEVQDPMDCSPSPDQVEFLP